jgi:hypothetical protein
MGSHRSSRSICTSPGPAVPGRDFRVSGACAGRGAGQTRGHPCHEVTTHRQSQPSRSATEPSHLWHFGNALSVGDWGEGKLQEAAMLIALVMLFGAGYIWHVTPSSLSGGALVVNRAMALLYLFIGELALMASLL